MKRLLLISYFYPPLGGSGVFRPLRLSKYLPRHNWQVTVLTVSSRVRALKDPSLLLEIPNGVHVERTPSLEPRIPFIALSKLGLGSLQARMEPWLMLPDDQRGWVPFATRRGLAILRRERHDVVLSTAGPYSTHLVGLRLREVAGVPWVADFRDEWTTNPYLEQRYPTRWHLKRNRAMELRVLESADRVVTVSQPWLDTIRSLAPSASPGKFSVMPNGYDAEHFSPTPAPAPDRFRIVYAGTFYGHRSPTAFLEAVRLLLATERMAEDDLEVVLVGHSAPVGGYGNLRAGLPERVLRVVPQCPYREALGWLTRAAALLLVIPRAGGEGNHTGKLFNYLASGRPILALAPEPNVAADLIRSSDSGIVVPPDDVAAIASAIECLYGRWKRGVVPRPDRKIIERYAAGPQAEAWARLLDRVAAEKIGPVHGESSASGNERTRAKPQSRKGRRS